MKLLAIESSCDETAAAVVEDGRKMLSNIIASQVKEHVRFGGVVPEIASRMHAEAISGVTRRALAQSGVPLEALDGIAVTYAPGLIGALLVGVNFAKPRFENANLPDIKSWNVWQKWMDDNNISYSKWSLGTKDETSSSLYPTANPTGYWTNTDLTPEGIWNRNHFRERYNKGWSPGCD